MVLEPNAIHNPWTVMVHSQDAAVTHPTMVTTIGLILLAPLAKATIASRALQFSSGVL